MVCNVVRGGTSVPLKIDIIIRIKNDYIISIRKSKFLSES